MFLGNMVRELPVNSIDSHIKRQDLSINVAS